jgi:hypothetical protein
MERLAIRPGVMSDSPKISSLLKEKDGDLLLRYPFNSSLTPEKIKSEKRCDYEREMRSGTLL